MAAESLLAFIGVPRHVWLNADGDLEQDMMEAMYDAGAEVLREAAEADVELRLWLNGAHSREWAYVPMSVEDLRDGMQTSRGTITLQRHPDTGRVTWVIVKDGDPDGPRDWQGLRYHQSCQPHEWAERRECVRVPVPVDFATLVDDPPAI